MDEIGVPGPIRGVEGLDVSGVLGVVSGVGGST